MGHEDRVKQARSGSKAGERAGEPERVRAC